MSVVVSDTLAGTIFLLLMRCKRRLAAISPMTLVSSSIVVRGGFMYLADVMLLKPMIEMGCLSVSWYLPMAESAPIAMVSDAQRNAVGVFSFSMASNMY